MLEFCLKTTLALELFKSITYKLRWINLILEMQHLCWLYYTYITISGIQSISHCWGWEIRGWTEKSFTQDSHGKFLAVCLGSFYGGMKYLRSMLYSFFFFKKGQYCTLKVLWFQIHRDWVWVTSIIPYQM